MHWLQYSSNPQWMQRQGKKEEEDAPEAEVAPKVKGKEAKAAQKAKAAKAKKEKAESGKAQKAKSKNQSKKSKVKEGDAKPKKAHTDTPYGVAKKAFAAKNLV